ncbi:hypothetical protein VNI00_013225 [Paramarasmius palmivorus]|uniref:Glucose-methanol-choline oxidoreductase N-terminal domain-containing protein n=1 Tax=Paramarasmius palmivorus TaxID=297713 RepID=A0AAW0BZI0_9AGAR
MRGTAACVTAGRLAAADPSLKILLLEAGPHVRDLAKHIQPGRYFNNLAISEQNLFTFHIGKPSKALNGRSAVVPTGRCVGGGSSVNFVMYTRASASDYDDWEKQGNPGWGSKVLIPLSNKAETFQVEGYTGHGTSGPIKISAGGIITNVGQELLDVATVYDKERGGDQAAGLEYTDDDVGRNQGVESVHRVTASRLVVLSAGAFGSPAILERSGIGSKELLQKLDIPVLVDLPGVGENYNDHNLVFNGYYASSESDTMDDIFRGTEEEIEPYVTQWQKGEKKGLMAHNGIDGGIKIRPNEKDLQEIGSTFKKRWEEFYLKSPDKPVMWAGVLCAYTGSDPNVPRGKYFSTGYYAEYPISTGRVHIKTAQDPYAPLDFEPGFLDDPADLHVLRWTYKHMREIARRMKHYRGEIPSHHPHFPTSSAAATGKRSGPDDMNAEHIVYTEEDNEAIDDFHRRTVETTWHSLGTCAMKPREKNGVVDPSLNVYGVRNLKVVDLSIAPSNVGANTYNTALVIGEKAAVVIARELGIKGVN